jgi:hypothetical protein
LATLVSNWYSPKAPCTASILNSASGIGSGDIMAPFRVQMEQLQRMPLLISSPSKEKRIAPQ